MARNKKPKRRYNPERLRLRCSVPGLADMFQIFNPIYTAFEQLANGTYFEADGVPVFKDCFGEYSEISAAMRGWNDCFARICRNTDRPFNPEPLNNLADTLTEGGEITRDLLNDALQVIGYTQTIFRSTPAEAVRSYARDENIAIQLQTMGLAA